MAEKIVINANNPASDVKKSFSVIRFGNVIGSRDCFCVFNTQLRQNINLTITHKDMTRFL